MVTKLFSRSFVCARFFCVNSHRQNFSTKTKKKMQMYDCLLTWMAVGNAIGYHVTNNIFFCGFDIDTSENKSHAYHWILATYIVDSMDEGKMKEKKNI